MVFLKSSVGKAALRATNPRREIIIAILVNIFLAGEKVVVDRGMTRERLTDRFNLFGSPKECPKLGERAFGLPPPSTSPLLRRGRFSPPSAIPLEWNMKTEVLPSQRFSLNNNPLKMSRDLWAFSRFYTPLFLLLTHFLLKKKLFLRLFSFPFPPKNILKTFTLLFIIIVRSEDKNLVRSW